MGIDFIAMVMLDHLRSYPVLLFIRPSSDRDCGIVATAGGAALVTGCFIAGPTSWAAIPLVLFVLTGICIAAVTELLRGTRGNYPNRHSVFRHGIRTPFSR